MPHTLPPQKIVRLSSGVPGLDAVLGGGFVAGSLYLLEGKAGAGKTILSNQIVFHQAGAGARVLYITLIAESHAKLLAHLTTLAFYDEALVSQQIHYLSAYGALREGGLDGLLQTVATAMRDHAPQFVVIDGFRSASEFSASPLELSQFIHELSTLVSSLQSTCFLLAPLSGNEPHPEHTLVDGLIELNHRPAGMRRSREIEVHKLRAANHMPGRHMFVIDDSGIVVYPRLESIGTRTVQQPQTFAEQVPLGVPGIDRMLHGGVTRGSTTNLLGGPGTGKTLLGLNFLADGLKRGENVVFMGFNESPARLLAKAARVGIDLRAAADGGALTLLWKPALEFTIDALAHELLEQVCARGATRVFIDGVEGFQGTAIHKERLPMFFIALSNHLRAEGVTVMFSEEIQLFSPLGALALDTVSAIFENILWLRHGDHVAQAERLFSVIKLRDSDYDSTVHQLHIGADGLQVAPRGVALPASGAGGPAPTMEPKPNAV